MKLTLSLKPLQSHPLFYCHNPCLLLYFYFIFINDGQTHSLMSYLTETLRIERALNFNNFLFHYEENVCLGTIGVVLLGIIFSVCLEQEDEHLEAFVELLDKANVEQVPRV